MSKTHAEIRFEQARKRLSESLKNLEKTVKEKLHEPTINSPEENDAAQKSATVQKLNDEINNLQKSLSDLGRETEFLNEKNKALAQKFSDFRAHGKGLIESVEADLVRIEEVIKNYDS